MGIRKLSVLLAVVLAVVVSSTALGAAQVGQVTVEARVKPILTVDGLRFRDLNANGKLDVYEDWRRSVDDRITDLLSQMTIEEKVGLLFHVNTGGGFTPEYPYTEKTLESSRHFIHEMHINHILDNNNGTPDYLANFHNVLQEIAEGTRLGIPITFSSDRASNAWGGMIDLPHAAFGTANDPVLAAKLFDAYSKEMAAVGYHLTLHPSGVELFRTAWGEDADRVAAITREYVTAYTANNVQTCLKHFPTNEYGSRRSPAELKSFDISWRAGIQAGAAWVMLTNRQGVSYATVQAHYDKETLTYLREKLGFDGVVLTDWFPVGFSRMPSTGVTADGVDVASLSLEERYKFMLDIGVDQFGGETAVSGIDKKPSDAAIPTNYPDVVVDLVKTGKVTEARIDESARRILRTKFELGLFDDPYVDPEAALAIAASPKYIAQRWAITDNATLDAARNPRTLALDHALQAAATVLLVNDGTLPLKDGVSVYVLAPSEETVTRAAAALSKYATVVNDISKADVAIARVSAGTSRDSALGALSDETKELISVALKAGVPTIVAVDSTAPVDYSWLVDQKNVAAILHMTYSAGTDHGSAMGRFIVSTDPGVLADMLFGRAEPSGKLAQEMPRSAAQVSEQWGDVPFDLGATLDDRMEIVGAIRAGKPVPINLGDPLFMYNYGMQYGLRPEFSYSTLVVPKTVKSGQPFVVSCLLENNGWDGYTRVEVYDGAQLIGSKFVAVNGGISRSVDVEVVLTVPGVHTIKVGPLSGQVEVK